MSRKRSRVPGTTEPRIGGDPVCTACLAEAERLRSLVRRGDGTPAELRRALELLEELRPPLGETVRVHLAGSKRKVAVCPRHVDPNLIVRRPRGRPALNIDRGRPAA